MPFFPPDLRCLCQLSLLRLTSIGLADFVLVCVGRTLSQGTVACVLLGRDASPGDMRRCICATLRTWNAARCGAQEPHYAAHRGCGQPCKRELR
eukprot:167228-Amphidinium_carterae.1